MNLGEQYNLTEENKEEMERVLQQMQKVNAELEYTFRKPKAIKAREEQLYIGTKLIMAMPMDECTFLKTVKNQDVTNRETRPGYRVRYPDGYISWSPKETFETAYRQVTDDEKAL